MINILAHWNIQPDGSCQEKGFHVTHTDDVTAAGYAVRAQLHSTGVTGDIQLFHVQRINTLTEIELAF